MELRFDIWATALLYGTSSTHLTFSHIVWSYSASSYFIESDSILIYII